MVGYLHLCKASLKCSSLCKYNELEQRVHTLCVRVLNTLYLAARLWWLSYCKYWSVWVGFCKLLWRGCFLVPARSVCQKRAWKPSCLVSSVVNTMQGSMELLMYLSHGCLNGHLCACWCLSSHPSLCGTTC